MRQVKKHWPTHEITFNLGPGRITNQLADLVYQVCPDARLYDINGIIFVDFKRKAEDRITAVVTAQKDLLSLNIGMIPHFIEGDKVGIVVDRKQFEFRCECGRCFLKWCDCVGGRRIAFYGG